MDNLVKQEAMEMIDTADEEKLYSDVREILTTARDKAYETASGIMTYAYWKVGERIVEQENKGNSRAKYGAYLIKRLSQELSGEFGTGFSVATLKNCRQLYTSFPQNSYGYSMIGKVKWSHLRTIMRINDEEERSFYLNEVANEFWSVKELERNIKSGYYKRIVATQTQSNLSNSAKFVKDPYVLEFMGIKSHEKILEKKLEEGIITHLQKFLLELGKGFCFVDRQMHICTETSDFYLDLVFYNYILKCFVLIDLKVDKLTHQDIGQMDMYIRMFDDLKKQPDDNPTIGIILCRDKDETMVKYSVLNDSDQIYASKYMTVLPTVEELQRELERNQEIYGD